ncbi:M61 family metallopeptidase [Curvibacter sp. CHRR-16]|uniref:M61 family metallopeptidase n=1 Tax=Curvibacter sp. CHRR-16 TaxID=2835872 RepID=UPI001BD9CE16|nr:peptidase M61 [Curvibacter sp. CHRR-16]MBT0570987.1 M61 family metallopeptidase [Curvibacter sp. CHRR-16]
MSHPSLPTAAGAVHYQVDVQDVHAHLFQVTLHIAKPVAQQTVLLPVWIPGSYLVREFAKNLQSLQASQNGQPVALQQLDKTSWRVDNTADSPLVLQYRVYALDHSVRTAWLEASRGFFNGTSLLLRVPEQSQQAHTLHITAPSHSTASAPWQLATGLSPVAVDAHGFGLYSAPDYDTLVDCPVEMGLLWSGSFEAYGIPHRFVVSGVPASFDGARLLADTKAICEAQLRFWHPGIENGNASGNSSAPFGHYVFMLNATHDGYGGLEHRNSTALIASRQDLPRHLIPGVSDKQPEGYTTLLGLISHEYFHTWNVKRLRPFELAQYDYQRENYTELLWFFEGFTSYYDDLLLARSGRLDATQYLQQLGKTVQQVLQAPGRHVQTVAQASWDAWVKYYRPDENTPNSTISYYTKGALVALCLDLTLRSEGHGTLDGVMRDLWQRCQGGPMREADVLAALHSVGQRSYATELQQWVHSTAELPVAELLARHGVRVAQEPHKLAQQLGLRVKDNQGSVHIQTVLSGSVAAQAGLSAGDEWLGFRLVDMPEGSGAHLHSAWRLRSLDDLPLYAGNARQLIAIVARDQRLLELPLQWPVPSFGYKLEVDNDSTVQAWLQPPATA